MKHHFAAAALAALAYAAPAIGQRPDPETLFQNGAVAFEAGQHTRAALLFRQVLVALPDHQPALANLATIDRALAITSPTDFRPPGARGAIMAIPAAAVLAAVAVLGTLGLAGLVFDRKRKLLWAALATSGLALATIRAWYEWGADPAWASVMATRTPLRAEPSAASPTLLHLKPGEAVQATAWTPEWVQVRHGTDQGWLAREAVAPID